MGAHDNRAQCVEPGVDRPECLCLHQHITDRGRFERAGEHGHPQSVRDELAQQPVLRPTAHDVHDIDRMLGQSDRANHCLSERRSE